MTTIKTDREGNLIGNADFHSSYDVENFNDYPTVFSSVNKSNSSESVYVTYTNSDNLKSIVVRFSNHNNNAVRFGDQLNGKTVTRNEILANLGLVKRVFVPETRLSIDWNYVKKTQVKLYEESNLTIKEMYDLGEGADLSEHKGKIAKGSNILIQGNKVEKLEVKKNNMFGEMVTVGSYVYIN